MEVIHTIGRRKTSVARVFISKGKGNVTVNKKKYTDYFTTATLQYKIIQPFSLTELKDSFDLKVTVKGGGITGQAEAIRLAILQMIAFNYEHRGDYEGTLKQPSILQSLLQPYRKLSFTNNPFGTGSGNY